MHPREFAEQLRNDGYRTGVLEEASTVILALIDEVDNLRATIIAMRDRDDRNGSLPPWYREQIDAALARQSHKGDEE